MMNYSEYLQSPAFWGVGLVFLVIEILYLMTLFGALQAVAPQNRRMEPGFVFLLLIPLFNLFWNFFVVIKMRDSLQAEYTARNLQGQGFGFGVGLAMSILVLCSIIPLLGILAALAAVVCWIIYWVQIAGYKSTLKG
ncbi:MAG TPA: hypothetical protein VGS99_00390 [Gammaproteobacteria bacterium]|nr:hypothetical protein [Gammaproteobacteria bacterium]